MRHIVNVFLFLASSAVMAGDYVEVRNLSVDATDVAAVKIRAGAGGLTVRGEDGLDRVVVVATITIPDADEDEGPARAEKRALLELERDRHDILLKSEYRSGWWRSYGRIDLDVRVPARVALVVEDGSGFIDIANIQGAVDIDDGSGSIDIRNVGSVDIDDGSGSINVETVAADVMVDDGSGQIDIAAVGGTVTIDDGSGSIRVRDVSGDLVIVDDGSGSLEFNDIRGTVLHDD